MSNRTPNQAMADTMASWQLPDAEAERVDKAYRNFYAEQALQPFRDARQRLRDRAARYARMARASELAHNRSTEPHIKKMHLSDSVRFYASYRAFSVASSSIFHALRDAEKEMRKHDTVAKLRAMA